VTLDDILTQLRDVDGDLGPEDQADARKLLLAEILSNSAVDLTAVTAAVTEKARNVNPEASDITPEALVEFALLADISDAISVRVEAIEEQREKAARAEHAAKLAERIASTKVLSDGTGGSGTVAASGGSVHTGTVVSHQGASLPVVRREAIQMVASSDLPGFFSGQTIGSMTDLTAAVISRSRTLARSGAGRQVPVVSLQRQVPETHLIADEMRDWHRMDAAADEFSMPGGSLAAALLKRMNSVPGLSASSVLPTAQMNALTAATVGWAWCGPMEIRTELCPIEGSLDAMLDLPTMVTTRGGVMWPHNTDYSALYRSYCFTEDMMTTDDPPVAVNKPCVSIPCPDGWDECRLTACSLCLETGILQARIDPSQVQRAIAELMIAHQRSLNAKRIRAVYNKIKATSGAYTDMTTGAGATDWATHGPGAFESLLSFVELQAEHIRTRRRLALNTTLEAVFPRFALGIMRADLSKKGGWDRSRYDITDADLQRYLLSRGIRAQFVWDWQDDAIGAAGAVTAWPTSFEFMMYKAGAFVAINGPSVQIEMVHDKALLSQNREIRLFAEDMYCVAYRCGPIAAFKVPFCPGGVSGGFAEYPLNPGPCYGPPPTAPAAEAPASPESAAVGTPTSSSLTATWDAPATGGDITGYELRYRTPASTGTWSAVTAKGASSTSHTFTGLDADTTYEVEFVAVGPGGKSSPVLKTGKTSAAAGLAASAAVSTRSTKK